jgi:CDP-Glycerol:Poly(glycerophosphate) glycerophosphotransferase
VQPILCLGSHPNDIAQLVTVARVLRDRIGVDASFATVAPPDVAAQVHKQVAVSGFRSLDQHFAVGPPPGERNPVRRARRWRDDNLAVVERVLTEVQPSAVLATVNPVPCLLLDGVAERGVPSLLLQLWFWGDRAFRRAWRADDRRAQESDATWKKRARLNLERRADFARGIGEPLEWNVRHATVAVEGPALRRQLVADGVPPDRVFVTGNPVLDELYELIRAPDAARQRIRSQLAVPHGRSIVTQFRSHEDRFPMLDQRTRHAAQASIISALRDGAPGATVVVKLHPKELEAERALLHSIDPDIVIAGTDVDANELMAASDVVVGTFSTTLLQAVALDRPAVGAMLWPGLDYWRRATDWSGVDRAFDQRSLAEAVQRNLVDAAYRQRWAARRAAFTRDRFLLDGHGASNVADLLQRMLEQRAAR